MENNKTHFGFKEVDRDQKSNLVKNIFSNVAKKYDLMNDLMSAGTHRLWKNNMINCIDFFDNIKIIDVAGGTGDIAFRIAKKAQEKSLNYQIEVVDINPQMLEVGRSRAVDMNLFSHLNFVENLVSNQDYPCLIVKSCYYLLHPVIDRYSAHYY